MQHCLRHMEEPGTGECRHCHGTFCARCLVYSFGPKKPPFCVGCALVASGVRSGHRPVYSAPTAGANEPAPFDTAPPLYADGGNQGPGGPGGPPTGGAAPGDRSVKSSWSNRRAQRQAAKAARRTALDPPNASGSPSGPLDASELEPLLSPTDRKALGRLSASNF